MNPNGIDDIFDISLYSGRVKAMASGAKAGLSRAKDMRDEAKALKDKEKHMFDQVS